MCSSRPSEGAITHEQTHIKVAVVTGASKGIGAAIASSLAAEGASVVVNYASNKPGADTEFLLTTPLMSMPA